MHMYTKNKTIKIEKLYNERLILITTIDTKEEHTEIQAVLNYSTLKILDINGSYIHYNNKKEDKTFNFNELIGTSLGSNFLNKTMDIEGVNNHPFILELFFEIYITLTSSEDINKLLKRSCVRGFPLQLSKVHR